MTDTDPVPGRSGVGFILVLAAVGASIGFTFGRLSAPPVDDAHQAERTRAAAERDRLNTELQSAREEANRSRQMLEQARRDLAAAQSAKADPPADPVVNREPTVPPPAPRRPAPRPARAPSTGPQP